MFLRYTGDEGKHLHVGDPSDVPLTEADAVMFLCPKCFDAHRGPVGTHSVICNRPRVPLVPGKYVGPGRWEFQGSGLGDLTLVAGSSSVQLLGGCAWHGFVRNGQATLGC